jgi:hypothetical protein
MSFLLNMSVWHTHSFTSSSPRNVTPTKHLNNLVRPVLKFVILHKVLKYHLFSFNEFLLFSYILINYLI